MLIQVFVQHSN